MDDQVLKSSRATLLHRQDPPDSSISSCIEIDKDEVSTERPEMPRTKYGLKSRKQVPPRNLPQITRPPDHDCPLSDTLSNTGCEPDERMSLRETPGNTERHGTKRRRINLISEHVWDILPSAIAPDRSAICSGTTEALNPRATRAAARSELTDHDGGAQEPSLSITSNNPIPATSLPTPPARDLMGATIPHPSSPISMPRPTTSPSQTPPSPSRSSVSLDSSLELQNFIAETATREHNSREAALAFYRNASDKNRTLALARQTQREMIHVRSHDKLLMLYRDPPAWESLSTWKSRDPSRKIEGKGRIEGVAVLNKTDVKGREGIQALMEAINRKRRMPVAPIQPANPNTTPATASRNPFIRKSVASPWKSSPQQSGSGTSNEPEVPTSKVVKPLVPISTLSMPVLPQALRKNVKGEKAGHPSEQRRGDLEQATLPCGKPDQNPSKMGSVKDGKIRLVNSAVNLPPAKTQNAAAAGKLSKGTVEERPVGRKSVV